MNNVVRKWLARMTVVTMVGSAVLLTGVSMAYEGPAMQKTKPFSGSKVNGGTVMHEHKNGKHVLTLSDDFKAPDTPDPHIQVVDSQGNTYLLNRCLLKGDKMTRTVTVPSYVYDIAKVQIYCAWAEVVLGEAPFDTPVK